MMATTATATITKSAARQQRVKELWAAGKLNREEVGKLLYEEREERCSVGGAGNRDGFHQWLREAGIPKQSAYRRIAEHEILIGVREPENAYDISASEPVPNGTTSPAPEQVEQPIGMCPVCVEHPHKIDDLPDDYSKHPELQARAVSRSHGMGLDRLRKLADKLGVTCAIKYNDGFKITYTRSFVSEADAREWLKTSGK